MITGANVIINTVGNLLLIPHYGIRASAVMTVVSESLQGTFYFYFVRKNITTFRLGTLFVKPALSALVMGIVLWPVRHFSLLLTLPIGLVVYGVMLLVTRFVGKDDLTTLRGLFRDGAGRLVISEQRTANREGNPVYFLLPIR